MFKAVFGSGEEKLDARFNAASSMSANFGDVLVAANIHLDTTEHWNAQIALVAKKDHLYVYSDYTSVDGEPVPGIKVGDGTSYLIDLPFVSGNTDTGGGGNSSIVTNTTEGWNEQTTLIGKAGTIYVYTDYLAISGTSIPGIKIGDGQSYLVDIPFVAGDTAALAAHAGDTTIHVTAEEKAFWNNKVTCFMSSGDVETLVFTKGGE